MRTWGLWALCSLLLAGYLGARLLGQDRSVFLPGETTSGHHQIELACGACHVDPFGGGEVLQEACINCHGAELAASDDSHPKSKFTDPRNADRLSQIDARYCISCHVEHRAEITQAMGLTLPPDYCIACHRDIESDRPTHTGMDHTTCQTGGCHNFHDNRALYEDFLLDHAGEPDLLPVRLIQMRDGGFTEAALALVTADSDAPAQRATDAAVVAEWAASGHARAGVNCSDCHGAAGDWVEAPGLAVCGECHAEPVTGFLAGKHGMRLAQDLPPMTPAMARIPMHEEAAHRELTCATCHGAHGYDTAFAAVQACATCHADEHTAAYEGSPHHQLWLAEQAGDLPPGSGVTCATCHMPRGELSGGVGEAVRVTVEHNQNATLRPNEKMIRPVCLSCHGLPFAIDALADPALVSNNFRGRPARHISSVEMAQENLERDRARRESASPDG